MTPHKSGGRGTFTIDRRFRGVGRIKRASGTTDEKVYGRLITMLEEIARDGRTDVLRHVRDGRLKPLELWAYYRRFGLSKLPGPERLKLLKPAVDDWLDKFDRSEVHTRNYRYAFKALVTQGKCDVIADLPRLLRKYRSTAKPTMFRIARAGCQAFLRDTVGKYHDLWQEVSAVTLKKIVRRKGKPQSPQDAEEVRAALGDVHGVIWWSMCVTGMGPGELWGNWEVLDDRIHVSGTKRTARDRDIPKIQIPRTPQATYKAFLTALREHDLQPYDARRTYAHWLELAGVSRTRRRIYMGHKVRDVTDLYEDHDVTPFLKKDASRVRRYLTKELKTLRLTG